MLKRICLCLTLLLTLSNCAALAPLAMDALAGASQRGIDVDANAGKAETQGDNSIAQNAATAVSVDAGTTQDFATVDTVVNEAGLDWWVLGLICLLAGWAIPSPEEMGNGVIRLIRAFRGINQQ